MAKGSQLAQLKSALAQAGLSRQSSGKKRKRTNAREIDNEKRTKKLQEIHQRLNPFDIKVTKLKHDVGGRKIKGTTGRPQASKQAGIEQRKKTLLKEYELRNHAGGILDKRFGENDPTMSLEERMLGRFTKERQRAAKDVIFNLQDEEELTHYGQSLSMFDDFDDTGLNSHAKDDDGDSDGKIDKQTVKVMHFGGFDDENEENDGEPPHKKSKAEVMEEVIAKSKQHKHERQLEKQQDIEIRHELDKQLDDIRGLLFGGNAEDAVSAKLAIETANEDCAYDQNVRELALDKRAKPKDRMKTEEELAREAAEALEKAERKRIKRMMGKDDTSSEDEKGTSKKARSAADGDDLGDDFDLGEDQSEWNWLGAGLERRTAGSNHTFDLSEEEGEQGKDSSRDECVGEGEGINETENGEDVDEHDVTDEGLESDGSCDDRGEGEQLVPRMPRRQDAWPENALKNGELPYTFPCPETLDNFLAVVEDVKDEGIPTVLQRIRALYHPSLAQDNKLKLHNFCSVIIDYILHITSPPSPKFEIVPSILPHVQQLSRSYPVESAGHFISKLKLMQRNLVHGISRGATTPSVKTWPGMSELALLWTISHVWPTSDMCHHVISPARLLMGSYLELCRIRSLGDISSGVFLCSLFYRFEEYSKRFVPEVICFLINAILGLAPHPYKSIEGLPGTFPSPDSNSSVPASLRLNKDAMRKLNPSQPDLVSLLLQNSHHEQVKINLLATTLELLSRFADLYKGLDGFVELFDPVADILNNLNLRHESVILKKLRSTQETISRLVKFAHQARRPLALQAHKPIPIASYIPKFENGSSSYLRNKDSDQERATTSKLRYQYKQERKGAIRELRKDSRFLSSVRRREQQENDTLYAQRMHKVRASLENERAEQKQMEREKAKEKRRTGRK